MPKRFSRLAAIVKLNGISMTIESKIRFRIKFTSAVTTESGLLTRNHRTDGCLTGIIGKCYVGFITRSPDFRVEGIVVV